MLKCNINRAKKKVWVKGNGAAQDLMVETAALIQEVYHGISEKSPEAAKFYKEHLIGLLLDPKSPVWKED